MVTLKIALRTLLRRKGRMALIGTLVAFGTFLITAGGTVASSAKEASRRAIIDSFTGDFIIYSERSRELPSPFAFNTPLPVLRNMDEIRSALSDLPEVEAYTAYAQNYGLIQVSRNGKTYDLPFIFYAVDPEPWNRVFRNAAMKDGSFFGLKAAETAAGANGQAGTASNPGPRLETKSAGEPSRGILISRYQNEQYEKNFGVDLSAGEKITVLGITEGGVNTVRSELVGIFEPERYRSVFNYINFVDTATYSELYNYTGVSGLPEEFNAGLEAAGTDEDGIFGLADDTSLESLDFASLEAEELSGFTMIAVRLRDHGRVDEVTAKLSSDASLGIKTARWDEASGFYAQISAALQAFIFLAVGLVFLVVTMIFMNTLIINVVERTGEIGTMRAVGAEKSFVRKLLLTEALALNMTSALVSMALSGLVLAAFSKSGLPLPETVSQFLIGGGPLELSIGPLPFVIAFAAVAAVSVLATLYPVNVATKITPLAAMNDR